MFNTLHLALIRKRFERGQVVCKEGQDSEYLFIICKGEFEVSKVIDIDKLHKVVDPNANKTGVQYLPKRKLVQ